MTIFVGIKCDNEKIIAHGFIRGYLIILGSFNAQTDFDIILKELFGCQSLELVAYCDSFASFKTDFLFKNRYKSLMQNKKIEYFSNHYSVEKLSKNIFNCNFGEIASSHVKIIACFDESCNLLSKAVFNKCIYVLDDISELRYCDYEIWN